MNLDAESPSSCYTMGMRISETRQPIENGAAHYCFDRWTREMQAMVLLLTTVFFVMDSLGRYYANWLQPHVSLCFSYYLG